MRVSAQRHPGDLAVLSDPGVEGFERVALGGGRLLGGPFGSLLGQVGLLVGGDLGRLGGQPVGVVAVSGQHRQVRGVVEQLVAGHDKRAGRPGHFLVETEGDEVGGIVGENRPGDLGQILVSRERFRLRFLQLGSGNLLRPGRRLLLMHGLEDLAVKGPPGAEFFLVVSEFADSAEDHWIGEGVVNRHLGVVEVLGYAFL